MHPAWLLVLVAATVVGCISDSKRSSSSEDTEFLQETTSDVLEETARQMDTGDVTDSGPHDVAETSDDTLVVEETVDTSETSDDTQVETEVVVVECELATDCTERPGANVCRSWACDDGRCTLVPDNEGMECEDGDLCTLGDTCRDGVCSPGTGVLACPEDPASFGCNRAVCDATIGCTFVPAGADSFCDNGSGAEPGSCVLGGYLGEDRCDGEGFCVDASAPTPSAAGSPDLAGRWFFVYTSFGRYAELAGARAVIDVDEARHALELGALRTYGPDELRGSSGYVCSRDEGAVELRVAEKKLIGHQLEEELMVVTDTANDGIAVLMRSDRGNKTMVNGSYSYFQTTVVFGRKSPTTWRGSMTFANGCLTGGDFEADPDHAGGFDFLTAPDGDCLDAIAAGVPDSSLFTLQTHVRAQSGRDQNLYAINYRGAVTDDGAVVLLVKERSGANTDLEYGITILVRNEAGPSTQAELAGDWRYNLHAKIGDDDARRDVGSVIWGSTGLITGGEVGTLEGAVLVPEGWATANIADNGLSQYVGLGGLDTFHSGVLTPDKRFIVGWTVQTPLSFEHPVSLNSRPRGGSMLLMLRP